MAKRIKPGVEPNKKSVLGMDHHRQAMHECAEKHAADNGDLAAMIVQQGINLIPEFFHLFLFWFLRYGVTCWEIFWFSAVSKLAESKLRRILPVAMLRSAPCPPRNQIFAFLCGLHGKSSRHIPWLHWLHRCRQK